MLKRSLLLPLAALICCSAALAAQATARLEFNPFDKPELMAVKPVGDSLVDSVRRIPELTATLVSEATPMVILEGELLKPGQAYEDYVLKVVNEQSAIFEREGKLVEIKVTDPDADRLSRR